MPDIVWQVDRVEAGLSWEEAARLLQQHGPNLLRVEKRESRLARLIRQFQSPVVLVLLGATVVSALIGSTVDALAKRMAGVPKNQLMMQKLMINQAYENMGLASTQMMATLFDGITRHSPEGLWFKGYAERHGFHAAVKWRDSGKPIPEGRSRR